MTHDGSFLSGGRGIRTPGTLTGTTVFKTAAIDHSATPPKRAFTHFSDAMQHFFEKKPSHFFFNDMIRTEGGLCHDKPVRIIASLRQNSPPQNEKRPHRTMDHRIPIVGRRHLCAKIDRHTAAPTERRCTPSRTLPLHRPICALATRRHHRHRARSWAVGYRTQTTT